VAGRARVRRADVTPARARAGGRVAGARVPRVADVLLPGHVRRHVPRRHLPRVASDRRLRPRSQHRAGFFRRGAAPDRARAAAGEFDFVITEGPADTTRSEIHREGAWTCVAGETLAFTLVSYDSSGNRKARGGERVTFGDAQVDDRGDGSYEIKYLPKRAGVHKVPLQRRPPRVAPRPCSDGPPPPLRVPRRARSWRSHGFCVK